MSKIARLIVVLTTIGVSTIGAMIENSFVFYAPIGVGFFTLLYTSNWWKSSWEDWDEDWKAAMGVASFFLMAHFLLPPPSEWIGMSSALNPDSFLSIEIARRFVMFIFTVIAGTIACTLGGSWLACYGFRVGMPLAIGVYAIAGVAWIVSIIIFAAPWFM